MYPYIVGELPPDHDGMLGFLWGLARQTRWVPKSGVLAAATGLCVLGIYCTAGWMSNSYMSVWSG